MQKIRPIFLTLSQCCDIVTSINLAIRMTETHCVYVCRKFWIKLVQFDLVDDICANVVVLSSFHSPFPYKLGL